MKEKDKVCPACGSQTHSYTCEICGRETLPLKNIDKNRAITHKTKEIKQKKYAYLNQNTIGNLFPILLMVIILVKIILVIQDPSGEYNYTGYDEYYNTNKEDAIDTETIKKHFLDYITKVDDEVSLKCNSIKGKGIMFEINNDSKYIYDADIMVKGLKDDFKTNLWMGAPYAKSFGTITSGINSCEVVDAQFYEMNYGANDIVYRLIKVKEKQYNITVNEYLNSDEIKELMMHIFAVQAVTSNIEDSLYQLTLKDTKAYDVYFEYHNLFIEFEEKNGFDKIDEVNMTF